MIDLKQAFKDKTGKIFAILIIVIFLGFMLRLLGIRFGLPDSTYVDSGHTIMPAKKIAYSILQGNFDIDPGTYLYPALFYNILATEFVVYGVIYGIFADGENFSQKMHFLFQDESNNHRFHLLARMTSAVAGTLTILFVFLLGTYAYHNDKRIGLIASTFLAFMYLHVKDSKYPMTDATMCLFTTIALIYIAKTILEGQKKDFILSGLFIGLATSVKWLPGTLLLPFTIAIIVRFLNERKRNILSRQFYMKLFLGFFFIFIGFVMGTPQFVPKFTDYTGRFIKTGQSHFVTKSELSEGKKGKLGQVQQGYFDLIFSTTPNWNEPLSLNSLRGAMDLPLLILTLIGLFYALYKGLVLRSKEGGVDIAFVAFILAYYFMEARPGGIRVVRYFFLILPLFCVIASRFLVEAIDYITYPQKIKNILMVISVLFFVAPTGARAFRYSYLQSHTDTRTHAIRWMHDNIPHGSRILMPGLYHPKIKYENYKVFFYSKSMVEKCILSLALLRENNVDYVVTSSYLSDRYFHEETLREYRHVVVCFKEFIDSLERHGKLFKEFKSNLWDQPGPTIKIYQLQY